MMMHAPPRRSSTSSPADGLTALTAASLAEFGHRDRRILDDAEYGFPRFIGTAVGARSRITDARERLAVHRRAGVQALPAPLVMHGI
ncbi:hypothetical protein HBB16_16440 [Pseudonocardia sp. MCCB 268]|nr:hypothetical protein [Pseudonocardia cytotoxica]